MTHTHTHTHTCRWDDGGKCSLHLSHPGILPQGQPGAVDGQQCGARGPSPSASPVLVRDRTEGHLFFLHVFVVVGFYGGNPGEHGENMQTPHRKAREQAPTCCTMRDLNPQPSCCEATVLRTEPRTANTLLSHSQQRPQTGHVLGRAAVRVDTHGNWTVC